MAERRLKELINSILDETTQDGFNQSDRHITDTLITFNGIDDILYDWYVNQYHYTTNKTRQNPKGKARGSARAAVNKDWGQLKPQRRGAYNSYVKAASQAVVANGYGVQLPGNPNQYVWRFYSWNNKRHSAEDAHREVNQAAMKAMASYVDKTWSKAEKALNRSSYINNSAQGGGDTKGSLASMTTNFAHGRYAGQQSPGSQEYGSTTGSIGVLEDIISGDLKREFAHANPVVDDFIEDIFNMFVSEGNIQILDTSSIGGHKNTIIIKGAVTSKRKNRSSMRSWDRYDGAIEKRIFDTMNNTFNNLGEEIMRKGTFAGYDWEDISASPTQMEIGLDKGVRKVLGEIKKTNPSAKITYAKKQIKQKKKTQAKGSNKKRKAGTNKTRKRAAKGIKPAQVRGRTKGRAKAAINPIGLTQLLNKSLAKSIMKNMGPYPRRLENRSGRFARSAEITNIAPLPKSVEIQYTYQKDPYEVFEPENGNPLASYGRDPQRIIGGTIRELAQSIMGTRFGLVRTKRV